MRDLVGGVARTTAGLWQGFADAVDGGSEQPADRGHDDEPAAEAGAASTPGFEGVPEGAMLVPRETWQQVLDQLGNLHEAGRELADARERAAKAEAQVEFLREQLSDARDRDRDRGGRVTTSVETSPDHHAAPASVTEAVSGPTMVEATRATASRARARLRRVLR